MRRLEKGAAHVVSSHSERGKRRRATVGRMQILGCLLQLLLVLAVIFYFAGFVAGPLRFRLWRWSVGLVGIVFGISLLSIEARAHPFITFVLLVIAALIAYVAVEHSRAERRRATTPSFLNLRTTGKLPLPLEPDHPFFQEREREDAE